MNDRCVTDGFDAAVGKETSDEDLVDKYMDIKDQQGKDYRWKIKVS